MSPSVTAFTETAALYAILTGDQAGARRIINDMHQGEQEIFVDQLNELLSISAGKERHMDDVYMLHIEPWYEDFVTVVFASDEERSGFIGRMEAACGKECPPYTSSEVRVVPVDEAWQVVERHLRKALAEREAEDAEDALYTQSAPVPVPPVPVASEIVWEWFYTRRIVRRAGTRRRRTVGYTLHQEASCAQAKPPRVAVPCPTNLGKDPVKNYDSLIGSLSEFLAAAVRSDAATDPHQIFATSLCACVNPRRGRQLSSFQLSLPSLSTFYYELTDEVQRVLGQEIRMTLIDDVDLYVEY